MVKRIFLAVGAVLMFASLVSAQTVPAGHWEGTCVVEGRDLTLALDLSTNVKSEWVGSMGVPSMNASGLVVQEIVVSGRSVKFIATELMMAKFDLTVTPEGRLKGTFSGMNGVVPIEFTRVGDAKVQLIAPSPAVSKELEGDWLGTLDMSGHPFRLVLHFTNQPDRTVAATLESLDAPTVAQSGATTGVPLNDVRQAGQSVEFGVKVAHSTFRGTLNKEGTELTGQWTHEAGSMPLTFRKR